MLLYLLPFFLSGISGSGFFQPLILNTDDFAYSLTRSLLFALTSTTLIILIALRLAILLSKTSFFSLLGTQLSFFLLPVLLGNISTTYVFKIILFNTSFFNYVVKGGSFGEFTLLFFFQFWQYGILFTYLFWLNIQNIPKKKDD